MNETPDAERKRLDAFLAHLDAIPAAQFQAGWSIVQAGLIRAGWWYATAEWGRMLPPDDRSPRPDYFVVAHGVTEAEARHNALEQASARPQWSTVVEPGYTK